MPKLGSKEPLFAIPGQPPDLARPAAGLRVPSALPRGDAALRERRAAERRRDVGADWTRALLARRGAAGAKEDA